MVLHGEEKRPSSEIAPTAERELLQLAGFTLLFRVFDLRPEWPVKNGDGFKPSPLLCLLIPLMQSTSARPGEAPPLCLRWRWSPVNGQ